MFNFIIFSRINRILLIIMFMWFWFSGGRTIIFTETKESASELAGSLAGARALHGDIQQGQREVSCCVKYYCYII